MLIIEGFEYVNVFDGIAYPFNNCLITVMHIKKLSG